MAKLDMFEKTLPRSDRERGGPLSDAPAVGDALLAGRYRLLGLIGKGSMGSVFRAHDLHMGVSCAIKMLSQAAAPDEEEYIRFVNEAVVISQIFHPNIVEVREFRRDEKGRPFLVMELLVGMDLHCYLRHSGRISLARVQEIVRQVASALHAVHGLGIVHRDIKPRNIFLARQTGEHSSSSEIVKVVDFGLSKAIGAAQQHTALGMILGTPEYLAPEGTLGRSTLIDERTDQWALAATAFRMLSGKLPFEDDDVVRMMLRIRDDPTPSLSEMVPALPLYATQAIERGLSKQKEKRFPSILEFARALCGLQTGLTHFSTGTEPADTAVSVPAARKDSVSLTRQSSAARCAESLQRFDQQEQTRPIKQSTLEQLITQLQASEALAERSSSSPYSVHIEIESGTENPSTLVWPSLPMQLTRLVGRTARKGWLSALRWGLLAAGLGAGVFNQWSARPLLPRPSCSSAVPPSLSPPGGFFSAELGPSEAPKAAPGAPGKQYLAPRSSPLDPAAALPSADNTSSRSSTRAGRPALGQAAPTAGVGKTVQSGKRTHSVAADWSSRPLQVAKDRPAASTADERPTSPELPPRQAAPAKIDQAAGFVSREPALAAPWRPVGLRRAPDTSPDPEPMAGQQAPELPAVVRKLLGPEPMVGSYMLCLGAAPRCVQRAVRFEVDD